MEGTGKILRRTIHTFLQHYQSFTSVVTLLALPASASLLLSQVLFPAYLSFHHIVQSRLSLLFEAVGVPASAKFFVALNVKLSQTIFSYLFTLPLTLTFLLVAKGAVLRIIFRRSEHEKQKLILLPSVDLYSSLLATHVWSSFAVLSANAAIFSLLFITFTIFDLIQIGSPLVTFVLSTLGAVAYSFLLAHVTVASNLAIVVSGVERCSGYLPLLKALLLVRERACTALTLGLVGNIGMAFVEMLFRYRVMAPYLVSNRVIRPEIVLESLVIAYLHAMVVVLHVVATCVFFRSFKNGGGGGGGGGDDKEKASEFCDFGN